MMWFVERFITYFALAIGAGCLIFVAIGFGVALAKLSELVLG